MGLKKYRSGNGRSSSSTLNQNNLHVSFVELLFYTQFLDPEVSGGFVAEQRNLQKLLER